MLKYVAGRVSNLKFASITPEAEDDGADIALDRLVYDSVSGVAGLEDLAFYLAIQFVANLLRSHQYGLRLLSLLAHLCIEGERPRDLDHIDRVHLTLASAHQVASESERFVGNPGTVDRH